MHVADEAHLGLVRDPGLEIDLQLPCPLGFLGQLEAERLSRLRLEVGRESPELLLLERLGVVQPDDQRGVDLVERPVELVGHEHERDAFQGRAAPA